MLVSAIAIGLLIVGVLAYGLGRRHAGSPLRPGQGQNATLRLLEVAAVAANEASTVHEAMRVAVEAICRATGWPVGRIHAAEADGWLQRTGDFMLREVADAPTVRTEVLDLPISGGMTLADLARTTGRPEALYDCSRVESRAEPRDAPGVAIRSAFAVPVITHGRVGAVLEFGSHERVPPDEHFLEILALVGVQLGRVAERAAVQQKLRQTQKLEAIGRLSAGIAHEINNPLAYAHSNLNQLLADWNKLRPTLEQLESPQLGPAALDDCEALLCETLEGVQRAVSIVRDITTYSRVDHENRKQADLHEIVESALRVSTSHQSPGVKIHVDRADDLPPISCVPSQMNQVFVNLIVNALEAASPKGWVGISTHRDRGRAVVEIEDTGAGMSPETQDRIFDPFFTTKAAGEGMGLGLAIAYEIVRSHGGDIRVISAEGAGTVMEVSLPL